MEERLLAIYKQLSNVWNPTAIFVSQIEKRAEFTSRIWQDYTRASANGNRGKGAKFEQYERTHYEEGLLFTSPRCCTKGSRNGKGSHRLRWISQEFWGRTISERLFRSWRQSYSPYLRHDELRFLSKDPIEKKLEIAEFRFNRLIFGLRPSPSILGATIKHHSISVWVIPIGRRYEM